MVRMTLSIPDHLARWLDAAAEASDKSRSAIVAALVEREARRALEEEMAEGYRALAAEMRADAETFRTAQAEVVERDPAR